MVMTSISAIQNVIHKSCQMADEAATATGIVLYPILTVSIMAGFVFLFTAIPVTAPMTRWWHYQTKIWKRH